MILASLKYLLMWAELSSKDNNKTKSCACEVAQTLALDGVATCGLLRIDHQHEGRQ